MPTLIVLAPMTLVPEPRVSMETPPASMPVPDEGVEMFNVPVLMLLLGGRCRRRSCWPT